MTKEKQAEQCELVAKILREGLRWETDYSSWGYDAPGETHDQLTYCLSAGYEIRIKPTKVAMDHNWYVVGQILRNKYFGDLVWVSKVELASLTLYGTFGPDKKWGQCSESYEIVARYYDRVVSGKVESCYLEAK